MNEQTHSTDSTTGNAWHKRVRTEAIRHSMAWLLIALVVLFVTLPFVEQMKDGRQLEAVLISLVLVAAVLAARGRVRTFALVVVLVAPAIISRWVYHFRDENRGYALFIAAFLVFVGFVIFNFLQYILRAPRVDSEVLCAAIATYLLLALLWTAAYAFVARLVPGSFGGVPGGQPLQGFSALYFSVITLTTIGYGDITPASAPARMLAMMEAMTGTMYMAVLIARLVSIHSSAHPATETTDSGRS